MALREMTSRLLKDGKIVGYEYRHCPTGKFILVEWTPYPPSSDNITSMEKPEYDSFELCSSIKDKNGEQLFEGDIVTNEVVSGTAEIKFDGIMFYLDMGKIWHPYLDNAWRYEKIVTIHDEVDNGS